MLAFSSSQSREKQMISAHNVPKPCRGSTGWFFSVLFFPETWKRELPRGDPTPAVAPTGISPMEKAQDPVQQPVMPLMARLGLTEPGALQIHPRHYPLLYELQQIHLPPPERVLGIWVLS